MVLPCKATNSRTCRFWCSSTTPLSGGGELIAAALQDNERAKIAGQRTVGKGSVQTPIQVNVSQDLVFKLSVGMLQRPNGKNMQRFADSKREDDWGVRPDKGFEIPVTASLGQRLQRLALGVHFASLGQPRGDAARRSGSRSSADSRDSVAQRYAQ